MQITIIGNGATGSHLLLFGRNWVQDFDAKILVADFDRIEQKNVMSQFHSRMGIRKNKARQTRNMLETLKSFNLGRQPRNKRTLYDLTI